MDREGFSYNGQAKQQQTGERVKANFWNKFNSWRFPEEGRKITSDVSEKKIRDKKKKLLSNIFLLEYAFKLIELSLQYKNEIYVSFPGRKKILSRIKWNFFPIL